MGARLDGERPAVRLGGADERERDVEVHGVQVEGVAAFLRDTDERGEEGEALHGIAALVGYSSSFGAWVLEW